MDAEMSYTRWQAIALNQLGYAVGLILSFATASLGFALSIIRNQHYCPGCWGKALMLAALLSLVLSVGLGIWCVINRLCDFRETRKIARDRERWKRDGIGEREIDSRLQSRRDHTDALGSRTWLLFWWQIGAFCVGVAMFVLAFGIAYHAKLF
jgi:hypothetical protein